MLLKIHIYNYMYLHANNKRLEGKIAAPNKKSYGNCFSISLMLESTAFLRDTLGFSLFFQEIDKIKS